MTNDPLHTTLCETLGCDLPILLAGMGGVARWELAAAIAEAGGFATLGMVREDPALITSEINALRAATDHPFAVNLIPAATDPALLEDQIQCCLDLEVRAFSFFWDVMPDVIARVKQAGCLVLHQVGTVKAASMAEQAGTDVLIAQGVEAGGHVHGRSAGFELAKSIRAASKLPVAIAGGISTGDDLAAAILAGLDGVQCGTAFLATDESFAHDYHKTRVTTATDTDTVLTDVFVLNWPKGAAVRVIGNSVTEALRGHDFGHDPATLPREAIAWDGDEPRLRFSTDSPLRTTSGDLEAMALFAGQGTGKINEILPAASRLRAMATSARQILTEKPQRPG